MTPVPYFDFDQTSYASILAEYTDEEFCAPWWDDQRACWCVPCRFADSGLRQYADGWEYALDGKRWPTAADAYEHRNDESTTTTHTIKSKLIDALFWIAMMLFINVGAVVWLIDRAWQAARRAEERWAPWRTSKWI